MTTNNTLATTALRLDYINLNSFCSFQSNLISYNLEDELSEWFIESRNNLINHDFYSQIRITKGAEDLANSYRTIEKNYGNEYRAFVNKAYEIILLLLGEIHQIQDSLNVKMIDTRGYWDFATSVIVEIARTRKEHSMQSELLNMAGQIQSILEILLERIAIPKERASTRANAKAAKQEAQDKVNAERQARFALEKAIKEATKQLNALYTLLNQCDDNQVAGLLIDIQTQQELVNSLYK